jgi:hypothetical protein
MFNCATVSTELSKKQENSMRLFITLTDLNVDPSDQRIAPNCTTKKPDKSDSWARRVKWHSKKEGGIVGSLLGVDGISTEMYTLMEAAFKLGREYERETRVRPVVG